MLKFQIYQSQLKGTSAYGKYFARIVTDQSLDIDGLATHMADHNTPFSRGTIKGILEDAVGCIKELLLDGKRVQLNNLVSFGLGIEHTEGADTADKFSVQRNVKSVKLIAGHRLIQQVNADFRRKARREPQLRVAQVGRSIH